MFTGPFSLALSSRSLTRGFDKSLQGHEAPRRGCQGCVLWDGWQGNKSVSFSPSRSSKTPFLLTYKSPTGWNDKSAASASEYVHQSQSEHVDMKLLRMSELGKSQHASEVSHAFSALIRTEWETYQRHMLASTTRTVSSTNKAFLAFLLIPMVLLK